MKQHNCFQLHIKTISEGSCDTEEKNQHCITEINYILLYS